MGVSHCSRRSQVRCRFAYWRVASAIAELNSDLQEKLADNGVAISFTQEFEDYMSTKGYEPSYGARPIKRLIQKELVNLLAKSILDGNVHRDCQIVVDVQNGQIVVRDK